MEKDNLITKEEAIGLMKTSVDIDDWNQKRELVRQSTSHSTWEELYRIIDQGGMCPKTLKANRKIKRMSLSKKEEN